MRYRKLAGVLGFALVVAALLSVGPAAGATSASWTYETHPSYSFAFPASRASALPTPSQCVAAQGLACYTPAEIRTGYDVPDSATGEGQTIVIVDAYGSPTIRSDLATFDAVMGLPDPTLNIIYPGGRPVFNPRRHGEELNWASETTLDVQWSHALAPAATIDLVIGANAAGNVLNNAQAYAVSHHLGNVMSLSFGIPEGDLKGQNGNNLQQMQAHGIYEQALAEGMTVLSGTGDSGGNNGLSFVNASYPASDPLVTGVGGTNLFLSDAGAYQSEDVWNDSDPALCPFGCTAGPFGATGGAPSFLFPGRSTSDVAFNASVYTGVLTFMSFPGVQPGFYFTGGTSEGGPAWAGIVADIDQAAGHSIGDLNPSLPSLAAAGDLRDVTVGQNGFFGPGESAGPGYDMPTGYGTPDVAKLIAALG